MFFRLIIFSAFLMVVNGAHALEFQRVSSERCSSTILLRGEIIPADETEFQRIAEHVKRSRDGCSGYYGLWLLLDSPGGDIRTALRIGRIIRGIDDVLATPRNCASACVFLLAGAVKRYLLAPENRGFRGVGLHRFYFADAGGSALAEIRARREALRVEISAFLREMDVSQRVLDISEGIPPSEVKWLTAAEAQELRLAGVDAAYDEREVAIQASELGLTVREYRSRYARVASECRKYLANARADTTGFGDCKDQIMYGMPTEEVARQRHLVHERCKAQVGSNTDSWDQASLSKWGACLDANPVKAKR